MLEVVIATNAFNLDIATSIATKTLEQLGFKVPTVYLIRFGQNAIFREPSCTIAVRVHRPGRSILEVNREFEVSRALNDYGVLATRVADQYGGLLEIDGFIVSLWDYIAPIDSKPTPFQIGRLFQEMQQALKSSSIVAPPIDWLSPTLRRLQTFESDKAYASLPISQLIDRAHELREALPPKTDASADDLIVHGDAHSGNIISGSDGYYLTDFERVSVGASEWDAVPMAVALRRFYGDEQAVDDFFRGFGLYPVAQTQLTVMQHIREVFMLGWLMQNFGISDPIDRSIHQRARSILDDDFNARWTAH